MNSAARLLNVISKLLAHPVDQQTLCHVVWANVFELGSGPDDKHDAVISALQAVRAEIDLTTTVLEAKGITPADVTKVPRERGALGSGRTRYCSGD